MARKKGNVAKMNPIPPKPSNHVSDGFKLQWFQATLNFVKDDKRLTLQYPKISYNQAEYICSLIRPTVVKTWMNCIPSYAALYEALIIFGLKFEFKLSLLGEGSDRSLLLTKIPKNTMKPGFQVPESHTSEILDAFRPKVIDRLTHSYMVETTQSILDFIEDRTRVTLEIADVKPLECLFLQSAMTAAKPLFPEHSKMLSYVKMLTPNQDFYLKIDVGKLRGKSRLRNVTFSKVPKFDSPPKIKTNSRIRRKKAAKVNKLSKILESHPNVPITPEFLCKPLVLENKCSNIRSNKLTSNSSTSISSTSSKKESSRSSSGNKLPLSKIEPVHASKITTSGALSKGKNNLPNNSTNSENSESGRNTKNNTISLNFTKKIKSNTNSVPSPPNFETAISNLNFNCVSTADVRKTELKSNSTFTKHVSNSKECLALGTVESLNSSSEPVCVTTPNSPKRYRKSISCPNLSGDSQFNNSKTPDNTSGDTQNLHSSKSSLNTSSLAAVWKSTWSQFCSIDTGIIAGKTTQKSILSRSLPDLRLKLENKLNSTRSESALNNQMAYEDMFGNLNKPFHNEFPYTKESHQSLLGPGNSVFNASNSVSGSNNSVMANNFVRSASIPTSLEKLGYSSANTASALNSSWAHNFKTPAGPPKAIPKKSQGKKPSQNVSSKENPSTVETIDLTSKSEMEEAQKKNPDSKRVSELKEKFKKNEAAAYKSRIRNRGRAPVQNPRKTQLMEALSIPVHIEKSARIMEIMGYQGGPLGLRGEGITEPIMPALDLVNRAGFGYERETPKKNTVEREAPKKNTVEPKPGPTKSTKSNAVPLLNLLCGKKAQKKPVAKTNVVTSGQVMKAKSANFRIQLLKATIELLTTEVDAVNIPYDGSKRLRGFGKEFFRFINERGNMTLTLEPEVQLLDELKVVLKNSPWKVEGTEATDKKKLIVHKVPENTQNRRRWYEQRRNFLPNDYPQPIAFDITNHSEVNITNDKENELLKSEEDDVIIMDRIDEVILLSDDEADDSENLSTVNKELKPIADEKEVKGDEQLNVVKEKVDEKIQQSNEEVDKSENLSVVSSVSKEIESIVVKTEVDEELIDKVKLKEPAPETVDNMHIKIENSYSLYPDLEFEEDLNELAQFINDIDDETEVFIKKETDSSNEPSRKRSRTDSDADHDDDSKKTKLNSDHFKTVTIVPKINTEENMTQESVLKIQTIISDAIDNSDELPLFKCHGVKDGGLVYSCHDKKSYLFIEKCCADSDFKMSDRVAIENRFYKLKIRLNSLLENVSKLFSKLERYNDGLNTENWCAIDVLKYSDYIVILIEIDLDSFNYISRSNFILNAGVDVARFSVDWD